MLTKQVTQEVTSAASDVCMYVNHRRKETMVGINKYHHKLYTKYDPPGVLVVIKSLT